jgi:hypothetical protein
VVAAADMVVSTTIMEVESMAAVEAMEVVVMAEAVILEEVPGSALSHKSHICMFITPSYHIIIKKKISCLLV